MPAKTLSAPNLDFTFGYYDFTVDSTLLVDFHMQIKLTVNIESIYG
jgi:hypothetical protein